MEKDIIIEPAETDNKAVRKPINLGAINIDKEYGAIGLSEDYCSLSTQELNGYFIDLQMLIESVQVAYAMLRFSPNSPDVLPKYRKKAQELQIKVDVLLHQTSSILKAVKELRLRGLTGEKKGVINIVNLCFKRYNKLKAEKKMIFGKVAIYGGEAGAIHHIKKTEKVGRKMITSVGIAQRIQKQELINEYEPINGAPISLSNVVDNIGDIMTYWEEFSTTNKRDKGDLESGLNSPNNDALLDRMEEYFKSNPCGKNNNPKYRVVATVYKIFVELKYIPDNFEDFARRLNKTFGYDIDAANIRKAINSQDYGGLGHKKGTISAAEINFFKV